MPFGILDTRYIDLPASIDETYLRGLRTRAGVDFPQLLTEIDNRLAALNSNLDPLLAALLTVTTEPFADTTMPVAFEIDERGEYTVARPQLVEGSAIMLPLRGYDVALGFTEDGLESLSLARILNNVDSLLLGLRRLHRVKVLERLFSDAEIRVDKKTTATSPGFAGSGTGDNVFTGPYPDGTPLEGGYTHYYAIADDSTLADTLKAARDRLRRWHQGPFDLIAPQAEIEAIKALPDFVSAGSALVRPGSGTDEALVDPNTYVGVYDGDIRVRHAILDFSQSNIAIFKSYGSLAPQNPLAWRFDETKGRAAILRSRSLYPLDQAVVKQDFGIGVNNRVGAALIYIGDTTYTPPTIN